MKTIRLLFVLAFAPALSAQTKLSANSQLFEGLGSHTRKVTTSSPEAQKFFDQGLNFYFGFNHGAAIRSFKEAARLDPGCAMAHWGIALANGPHINFPMVLRSAAAEAWSELRLAQENAERATPADRALIAALAKRYANPQPDDRSPLDKGYADAMRDVWKYFPGDADTGVLFAEGMLDLRPWDQWTPAGLPQPGTDEILATLEAVLKLDRNHPFANHLTIHAIEASPHPERAVAAADRLRDLQPGLGHNVHMPSHIYIRVGRWDDAVDCNVKAVVADQHYRESADAPEGFLANYIGHNRHMLAYAAMMTGQRALALEHIRALAAGVTEDFRHDYGEIAEVFSAMPFEVLTRFGEWDQILTEPDFPESMPLARAIRRGARGIALAARGEIPAARAEQAAFLAELKLVPPKKARRAGNTRDAVVGVLTPMLEGEILAREGKFDAAFAQLRAAVQAEDALRYNEPPDWLLPVRHALGASLLTAGRFADAEQVYRGDLGRWPENGWSLYGLARALRLQKKNAGEAADLEARFKKIWAKADLELTSSCLCQPGT